MCPRLAPPRCLLPGQLLPGPARAAARIFGPGPLQARPSCRGSSGASGPRTPPWRRSP